MSCSPLQKVQADELRMHPPRFLVEAACVPVAIHTTAYELVVWTPWISNPTLKRPPQDVSAVKTSDMRQEIRGWEKTPRRAPGG